MAKPGAGWSLFTGMSILIAGLLVAVVVEDSWRKSRSQQAADASRKSASPEVRKMCDDLRAKGLQPGTMCPKLGE